MSFQSIRIAVLLCALVLTAGVNYWEQWAATHWTRPLDVVIYPIGADHDRAARDYVEGLTQGRFQEIADFLEQQSERYSMKKIAAVSIRLGPEIAALPPDPPAGAKSALTSILWSLKLRYYAFRATPFLQGFGKIRLFVVYHEGGDGKPLQHSLGLRQGMFGIVHAFAQPEQDAQNNVVIAHELLHTLGATDKYDASGLPVYPEGFGVPEDGPRYPQARAEIMAGRVAVSPTVAAIPRDLGACVIGSKTAYEINW
ncbi:MAG: hypothetical protein PHX38_12095 [Sulfuricella sp.]|nr:hypothetical protein [Sulfuricella sp.]